jgi:hypothetical protein
MEKRMKPPIPSTDSIDALARFWDSHDVTDYSDELEEVKGPVFKRSDVVRVPLTAEEHDSLRRRALKRGVDESALIHEWIREKLQPT